MKVFKKIHIRVFEISWKYKVFILISTFHGFSLKSTDFFVVQVKLFLDTIKAYIKGISMQLAHEQNITVYSRSSRPEVLCRKTTLENLSTGRQLCWSLFLTKLQAYMKIPVLQTLFNKRPVT